MSTDSSAPGAPLRRMVRDALGEVDRLEERTVPFGEARVWAVWRDGAIVAWLKRHRSRDKARREIRAYREWLPAVGWGVPELLATSEDAPNALLTAPARGERADLASLTDAEARALFRRLGAFLAAMHAVAVPDPDPEPLSDALRERAWGWCERAEDILDADLVDAVRQAFDEPISDTIRRVPCHRDLQLHNLFIDRSSGEVDVMVIDFGQSRLDVWLSDLVKLFQHADPERLPLRQALLEGYGRRLRPDEADLLDRLRGLHGLATYVWASSHGDQRGMKIGREVLSAAVERWRD